MKYFLNNTRDLQTDMIDFGASLVQLQLKISEDLYESMPVARKCPQKIAGN
jgi:hypothetical protein